MLATIALTVCAFALLMAMMAIGVIVQGKRLSGSCGGNTDSPDCRCTPEKQARCRADHEVETLEEGNEWENGDYPITSETLARPGEERLIQLQSHAPSRD